MSSEWVRGLRFTGAAAAIGGWLVILAAISHNGWFRFTEHAFSDLGHPDANVPWLFNYGMMINGLLIVLYGFYLVQNAFNKTGAVGGGFTIITGVFLVLIGVFDESSRNHFFVSVWFFTQGALTVLTWGLALFRESRWSRYGVLFLGLSIIGALVTLVVPWPSTAVAEAWGILLLNMWMLGMTWISPGFDS